MSLSIRDKVLKDEKPRVLFAIVIPYKRELDKLLWLNKGNRGEFCAALIKYMVEQLEMDRLEIDKSLNDFFKEKG